MKRKNLIVILTLIITGIFIAVVSTSYAYLKREVDTGKKVELKVGMLDYKIESTDLKDNKVIVNNGSTKVIEVEITSLNKVTSKYELYYNILNLDNLPDNVYIGYSTLYDYANGVIDKDAVKKVSIIIKNNSSENIEFEFGVQGGLSNNELVLTKGNKIDSISTLKRGMDLNPIFKQLAGSSADLYASDNNIKKIALAKTVPTDVTTMIVSIDNAKEAVAWFDNGTIYIHSDNLVVLNPSSEFTFGYLTNLTDLGSIAGIDTSYVSNMGAMFQGCSSLSDINVLANWNISNVKEIYYMFRSCTSLVNISPLANWDTSNVIGMEEMFGLCSSLSNIDPLSNWNTSSLKNMITVFKGTGITNLNALKNWDVSNVTNMSALFANCMDLVDINGLSNWNILNVQRLDAMFDGCGNLVIIDGLANWNTSNVEMMHNMFRNCSKVNSLVVLNNWNVSKVTDMTNIFGGIDSSVSRPSWYHD